MKKRIFGRQLSQNTTSRRALYRSLVRALVAYGKIETTKAKAKSIQPLVDKLIRLAKKDTVADRRRIYALLGNDRKATQRLSEIVKTNFTSRNSGYTRTIKLPVRRGDSSQVVRLEWTEEIAISDKNKVESDKSKKGKKEGKESKVSKKKKD